MYQETIRLIRGNKYARRVVLNRPNFDWTGANFLAHVREKPSGTLLYDCAETTTVDTSTEGTLDATITIPGTTTSAFPARCFLEIRVSHDDAELGPITLARFQLDTEAPYARD